MRMWWNADTRVLGTRTERCAGSSPVIRTKRERMDLPIKLPLAAFSEVDMWLCHLYSLYKENESK